MKLEEALKMKKFASPIERAVVNTIYTGNWLTDQLNQVLKEFGLSEQQFNVLRILKGQKGNPINLCSIQERMLHRMSNATRLVEKLRKKGLVTREICDENRRMVDITITEKGLETLEKIMTTLKVNRPVYNDNLTGDEAKLLGDLLDKLRG